jgi:molybdopterin molybdotransferase
MIALETAQTRLIALKPAVAVDNVPLDQALGRYAATPVIARRTQPPRALSAMDGYAIRFADMPGPWRVTGEAAAGVPFDGGIGAHEAVRIFTGAALPDGADTIVIQEDIDRAGDMIALHGAGPSRPGESVRQAGEDFTGGTMLIPAGALITPARIALAAIGGHDHVAVHRRIRVMIATTGSELQPVGGQSDGLPDSNGPMIAAQLAGLPVSIERLGIVRDDPAALKAMIDRAHGADILVTTGGASVGDHDLVRPALIAAGAVIDFWKVAIRPGKPVLAATLGDMIILGLPGNPVSAFVTAQLFLIPLIAALAGAADPLPRAIGTRAGAAFPAVGTRTDFVRARWQDGALVPARAGDSGALMPLAEAQALVIRPAGSPPLAAGDEVTALLIT